MNDETDRLIAARIRAVLDQDLARLDQQTVMRLRLARRAALDGTGGRSRRPLAPWLPAGAIAAVLAAVLFALWPQADPVAPLLISNLEDTEIVLQGHERLELYRDLEFFRWLAANERQG